MATSGSTSASGSFASATLELSRTSVNTGGNYSTFYYKLSIYRQYNINSSASKSWSISINGSTVASGTTTVGGSGTKIIKDGHVDIYHDADGSKNLSFSFSQQFDVDLSPWVGTLSNSGSFWVDSIPRTSIPTLNISTQAIGSDIIIHMNRASTAFTHTIVCSFGSYLANIAFGVTDNYQWKLPNELANQIPNANSGWGGLIVHTYSGETHIGTSTVNFTATVPDNATFLPSFTTITHSETVSAVSTGVGLYVQGNSRIKLDMTGLDTKHGATIWAYGISFDGVWYDSNSVTSDVIKGSGNIVASATLWDSRGKTVTKTVTINVLPYTPPSVTDLTPERVNSNGTPNQMGTSIKLSRSASSSSLTNGTQRNVLKYTIKTKLRSSGNWTTTKAQTTVGGLSLTGSEILTGTFDATKSYDIMIEVTDLLNTTIALKVITTGQVTMSWGRTGIGVGKIWEQGALDVGGNVYVDGNIYMKNFLELKGGIPMISFDANRVKKSSIYWNAVENADYGMVFNVDGVDAAWLGRDAGLNVGYVHLRSGLIQTGGNSNLNISLPNGQYMLLEQGSGATIFRGHQTRLVFHDASPHLRVESFNGGYCELNVGGIIYGSDRKKKKNINKYGKSALREIIETPVYEYHMEDEKDDIDLKHVGIMMQEAPLEVVSSRGNGVDAYAMQTLAWKAIQELAEQVEHLEKKLKKR